MIDVAAWLRDCDIEFTEMGEDREGRRKFLLAECPFDPSHKGKDAAIFQDRHGKLGFKCFHDSCSEYHWYEARDKIGGLDPKRHSNGEAPKPLREDRGRFTTRAPAYNPERISLGELCTKSYAVRWLIEKTLRAGAPLLIGGPYKALKTSITLDMLISIASGTPFLDTFEVITPHPVYFVSGEIDEQGIQDKALAICQSRELRPNAVPLHFSFRLPRIAVKEHLETVAKEIRDTGAKLFVLDPAYLALLNPESSGDASNLFSVGSILREFCDLAADTGCTMALIHHLRKPNKTASKAFTPPTLGDFAYAGFAEFARQWVLLGRREAYVAGSGRHALYIECAGSGGHGHAHALEVNEGDDFVGRLWRPEMTPWEEAEARGRFRKVTGLEETRVQRVREALAQGCVSLYAIKETTKLNGTIVRDCIETLTCQGIAERGPQGYRLIPSTQL